MGLKYSVSNKYLLLECSVIEGFLRTIAPYIWYLVIVRFRSGLDNPFRMSSKTQSICIIHYDKQDGCILLVIALQKGCPPASEREMGMTKKALRRCLILIGDSTDYF